MSGSRRAGVVVTAIAALGVCVPLLSSVASATGTSSITGSVYEDANRNGVRDAGEAPLTGNRIDLYTSSGTWVTGALADSTGQFRFDGLADGTYSVRFATSDWLSLRSTWVPTTTGSLYFVRSVSVAGSANADFGLRQIVRSTTVGSPISAAVASNGTRFESYDDVVDASTLVAAWQQGGLLTAEPSNVVVRFDVNAGNSCVTSVAGSAGSYSGFSASVWFSYLSWLDDGDRGLFHEYGHAWTIYYEQIVQQEDGWGSYLAARGLTGDSRLYSDKNWDPREMIAEDYRQLFGSPNARSYALANTEIVPADQVPGLADWMRNTFTQAPAGTISAAPEPAPASTSTLNVSDVAVNPSPVSTQGTISFAVNEPATVTVQVVDSAGAVVRTLLSNASEVGGTVSTVWDRKNSSGRRVKAGTYTVMVGASDAAGEQASSTLAFQVVDVSKRK
jgi:hypothetical protein